MSTERITEQQKIDAGRAHQRLEVEQLRQDIVNANKQKRATLGALEKKVYRILFLLHQLARATLGAFEKKIEQLNANIALKRAGMGTWLVDHLTPEERDLLSRLNPEIKDVKETLVEFRTKRVEFETKMLELGDCCTICR